MPDSVSLPPAHPRYKKLWRYVGLYGWRRALVKAAGRKEMPWLRTVVLGWQKRRSPFLSVIGCGQFAFSTLCYFLYRSKGRVFLDAFDTNTIRAAKLARFYRFSDTADSAGVLLANPDLRTVYVASNHASHTPYALEALKLGLDVYLEKPLCTNWQQYDALRDALVRTKGRLFAGYNRPFAAAIRTLRERIVGRKAPVTISCLVHGHLIAPEHWYRRPEEGTRICGNAGHWLDLAVHLLKAVHDELPRSFRAQYLPADPLEADDNFSLALATPRGDIFNLVMTSRSEPFEGVHEHIECHCGDVTAFIADFREMQLWQGHSLTRKKYRPKDVGHRKATLQPFLPRDEQRDVAEVLLSTALMLHVTDMVRSGTAAMSIDLLQ